MAKYVKQIVLGDDEEVGIEKAADEAMTPKQIADQLEQIDVDDLNDTVDVLLTRLKNKTTASAG